MGESFVNKRDALLIPHIRFYLLRSFAHTAREKMIGWYHTGPKLRASDQEINDLLKRYIAEPVMVIVDVRPQTVGIPTDAYFAVEEIKDVSSHGCISCRLVSLFTLVLRI